MENNLKLIIRKATPDDIPQILALIRELAEYENALQEVSLTEEDLKNDGFGETPLFFVTLAETDQKICGMAFWYFSYSTWKGKCLYLEDLVVRKEYRRMGIGKRLFDNLILQARQAGARRLQWQVLDWNISALAFYKRYNAHTSNEWLNLKLTDVQIQTPETPITFP